MSDLAPESSIALVGARLDEAWSRNWPGTSMPLDNRK
jgi:hypothetical protein